MEAPSPFCPSPLKQCEITCVVVPPTPPHPPYHHHHPTLHHTGLAVEGRSRNRFSERCYRAQTRHGRCWTSLKSSWWCSVDSLGSERKDQFKKKKGWIWEMAVLLDTDWKAHAAFLPQAMAGQEAHFSDKEIGNGMRQGGSRVKCLGSIWFKCPVPEGWLSCFKKETLSGLLAGLFVVPNITSMHTQAQTTLIDYLRWQVRLCLFCS